jgi:hypothetical protein
MTEVQTDLSNCPVRVFYPHIAYSNVQRRRSHKNQSVLILLLSCTADCKYRAIYVNI